MSFSSNEDLYCVFFNKTLLQDFSVEDPYRLVRENNWTMSKFNELIRTATVDLDGDGVMTKADQFGYASSNTLNWLWSGGSHITAKDENNIPYLDYLNERTLTVFDLAFEITNNEYTFKGHQWIDPDCLDIFADGRALFYSTTLNRVNDLRDTGFDHGIVPYPKFDSAQERYYSYVDGHTSMMAIPLHLPNEEFTGILLEELSFESYRSILPGYYDVVLNVKMVRDLESVEMLKILFDSKVFDFGYAYGDWGTSFIFLELIHQGNRDFVSSYERGHNVMQRTLDRALDEFAKLD
jgi:hypothetical protein